MKKTWLLAVCLVLPMIANASGFAGLDYVSSKVEPDRGGSAKPSVLQFKLGTWINRTETLGGEVRIGLGLDDDSLGNGTKVEIDRQYGAYFRGQFPNSMPIRPYGLIGVTRVETTHDYRAGGSSSKNYSDLSLGLGVDFTVSPKVFLSVEYLRAVDSSGDEVNNLAFGVNGRF